VQHLASGRFQLLQHQVGCSCSMLEQAAGKPARMQHLASGRFQLLQHIYNLALH
jgi:hypothetical protein